MSEASVSRKAALWVGVVFLLGAALGGMLGFVFAHRTAMAAPAQMTETEKRAQKVQRLTQELNLAPDQQKQIEEIIASVQAQYKAVRQSTEPQINEARQKGREQIRAVLTPEQKPKFEQFLKRLDDERKKNAQ
jgi:Spy/CpxP family protein refolding chaperone